MRVTDIIQCIRYNEQYRYTSITVLNINIWNLAILPNPALGFVVYSLENVNRILLAGNIKLTIKESAVRIASRCI
jgi:hypothetical protein